MVLSGGGNIIGFIGAGKAGCSLAYYFRSKGIGVSGFYSRHDPEEDFEFFDSAHGVILKSDIIFITVTDTAIEEVWNGLDKTALKNKIVCHCSGSLTSDIFVGADKDMVCSVHPMLAFNSRRVPLERISRAFFTLEGGKTAVKEISRILDKCENKYRTIDAANKVKYHAAACFASNFAVAVSAEAFSLMEECGFGADEAREALSPLIMGNACNICKNGIKGALTGPVSRGDAITVKKHLSVLSGRRKEIYKLLSMILARESGHDELGEDLE